MRLSLRAQKLVYTTATGGSVVAAVCAIAMATRPVGDTVSAKPVVASSKASSTAATDPRLPTKDDFAQLWERPLRQALYDPPPPKQEVKQLPPIRVELLGTIIEEANSMALVRSEKGTVEYKRVGDSVGPADSPATLVEIDTDAITIERETKRVTLKVSNKTPR